MSHMNMAGMSAGGGALGGMALMNNGANGTTPRNEDESNFEARLNTHIYGFFLKSENYDCARALLKSGVNMVPEVPQVKRRDGDMNGIDEAMQTDSKDDVDSKRPLDLPPLPGSDHSNFLLDWYSCFWDLYLARTKSPKATPQALQYMHHTQQQSRFRQEQQQQQHLLRPTMMPGALDNYNFLRYQQAGGMMNGDLRQKTLQNNNRNAYQPTPAQIVQLKTQHQQQQIMQQHQMRRDPSDLDINGQRPRTPSSGDNAPSPSKRPRLDGPFGQQMIPNGRGPPQGLQGQPMMESQGNLTNALLIQNGIDPASLSSAQIAAFQAQNMNVQQKSLQVYTQNRSAQRQSVPKPGMQGQGSPMMQQGMELANGTSEYFVGNGIHLRNGQIANGSGGNHALQDYQMQLMLLEQQNKKRLLLARQEQDSSRPEGQAGIPGAPGYAPGMSPQGSHSGPSPGPNDQMKRGSPKMGSSGIPGGGSPIPDGTLSRQGGSPAPMNYPGQMAPDMLQQMKMADGMGVVGPNGMRPPNSAPQFNGGQYTPQQMEALRARGIGPVPNGTWPQAPPGQAAMMQQPAPPQQTSQMGTPQPRSMPPPTIPIGAPTNGRPTSPAHPVNPPSTPSQTNKSNPSKAKKEREKPRKQPQKKPTPVGPTASTPATDAENQPPTPIPSTPITPMAPASFSQPKNDGQTQAGIMQGVTSAAHTAAPAQQPPDANSIAQFPGLEDNSDYNIGAFNSDMSGDVLENFDFDSFLQSTDDGGFQFDAFGMPGESVEAAAGDQ